jgi:phosphotriesterase-related protein
MNPFTNTENMVQNDVELAIKELTFYKRAGGRSLVDVTSMGMGRNPLALREISERTGIQIICGCGFYVGISHPKRVSTMSEDDLTKEIVSDIVNGIDESGIKPGIIGEIGTSLPLERNEVKSLRAAARAHLKTKLKVNIHPYCGTPFPWGKKAHKLLDIMQEEGIELSDVILSHMDANGFNMDEHKSLAKRGAFIEYDGFGNEVYFGPDRWDPRDVERVSGLVSAIKAGLTPQLLISHDVCLKVHMREFGGYGYDHILSNIIPMLKAKGVSGKQIDQVMCKNPKKILALK